MKVTFIVHYFPPLNSTGARRVLAFSKYLHRRGHEIAVITTTKKSYDGPLTDTIPEYCNVIQLGGNKTFSTKPSTDATSANKGRKGIIWSLILLRRSLTSIFGQFLDHRIIFALKFRSSKLTPEAKKALQEADIIISSCPPWPVHLAAYFASKIFKKPWIADYRDQFSGNHLFEGNFFSSFLEKTVERWLLSHASAVTVVSTPMEEYYRDFHSNVITIENGYDAEFIEQISNNYKANTEHGERKTTIRYLGTITKDRIPKNFFSALRSLPPNKRENLTVEFYGECKLLSDVIRDEYSDIQNILKFLEPVPYSKSIELMLDADALLFMETSSGSSLSAQGVLTTKLFEYMAVQRPIVADISPETLVGDVISKSGLGLVCSSNIDTISRALDTLLSKTFALSPNQEFISTFSREQQTRRLESLLQKEIL